MKAGIILLCRYTSSRLPGKILKEINGKPIISYILERLQTVVDKDDIVITTSTESTDNEIVEYCNQNNFQVYRDSLHNVAERFLNCALEYGFDYAVRINGDNLFAEMEVLDTMIKQAVTGEYDYLTNTKNRTFPQGMSVEIVRTAFYQEVYKDFSTDMDFEHVTWYLHQNPEVGKHFYYHNGICPEAKGVKFAIDEQKDFDLASSIISKMDKNHTHYNLQGIYELYKQVQNERVAG